MSTVRQVVSVSLGSSQRDHEVDVEFLGIPFRVSRRGVDGEFRRAVELLRELDGKVDAIGLGGVDIYLYSRKKRYELRDGRRLREVVTRTPVVDGSGLKNTLERETIAYLARDGRIPLRGRRVLMVCAMDRFGMAQALVDEGADVTFGDLIFSLKIDQPIHTLEELEERADRLLPEVCKLPISMIYPTGKSQKKIEPSRLTTRYYRQAEVIAGDFHFIRKYMPSDLKGKTIITNTVTAQDVVELRRRGVEWLVTTTPEFQGRSFGTNVLEAVFLVLLGKPWEAIRPEEYLDLVHRLGIVPRIENLQDRVPSAASRPLPDQPFPEREENPCPNHAIT